VTGASPRIVFLAGLSGSGKSTAMAALEDLGFYCVDNLPVQLIDQFLALCAKSEPPIEKIALAIDTREPRFLAGVRAVIEQLRERGAEVSVLFLDCANDALVSRYRETRRVHPQSPTGTVEEGIAIERRLLVEMARLADQVIDTSSLNIHQLKAAVVQYVSGAARPTVVNLISFGFRYGTPPSAELLFDVRFLANPYFEVRLRSLTGQAPEVIEYVLKTQRGTALRQRLRELLGFLLPLYDAEGKAYLTIGIGCTGGRHRSVVVAEALAGELRAAGREVNVEHRDVERGA
jgi:RNase adapter protein RapZ